MVLDSRLWLVSSQCLSDGTIFGNWMVSLVQIYCTYTGGISYLTIMRVVFSFNTVDADTLAEFSSLLLKMAQSK